jgi:molybdate transport system substrate-binding protein
MTTTSLKMLSSMATRELLRELAVAHQAASSQPVASESAGGVDVAKRVQAGEAVDVVVLARAAIDKLAAHGAVIAASCVDLVRSGIAVAVHDGAPRPDVSSEAAVKRTVLAATTLSYSTGPSGVYLEETFERWGILEQLRPRIVVPPPGVAVGSLIAAKKVELGFQQLSELKNLEGVAVAGMLPPEIQSMTTFSGAITSVCTSVAAAQGLLDYMASADRAALKARHGMEPATT